MEDIEYATTTPTKHDQSHYSDVDSGYDDHGVISIPVVKTVVHNDPKGRKISTTSTEWITLKKNEKGNTPPREVPLNFRPSPDREATPPMDFRASSPTREKRSSVVTMNINPVRKESTKSSEDESSDVFHFVKEKRNDNNSVHSYQFVVAPRQPRSKQMRPTFRNIEVSDQVHYKEETTRRVPRRKNRSKSADGRIGPQNLFSPIYSKILSPETMRKRKNVADILRQDCILEEEYYKIPYEECNWEIINGRLSSSETRLNALQRFRRNPKRVVPNEDRMFQLPAEESKSITPPTSTTDSLRNLISELLFNHNPEIVIQGRANDDRDKRKLSRENFFRDMAELNSDEGNTGLSQNCSQFVQSKHNSFAPTKRDMIIPEQKLLPKAAKIETNSSQKATKSDQMSNCSQLLNSFIGHHYNNELQSASTSIVPTKPIAKINKPEIVHISYNQHNESIVDDLNESKDSDSSNYDLLNREDFIDINTPASSKNNSSIEQIETDSTGSTDSKDNDSVIKPTKMESPSFRSKLAEINQIEEEPSNPFRSYFIKDSTDEEPLDQEILNQSEESQDWTTNSDESNDELLYSKTKTESLPESDADSKDSALASGRASSLKRRKDNCLKKKVSFSTETEELYYPSTASDSDGSVFEDEKITDDDSGAESYVDDTESVVVRTFVSQKPMQAEIVCIQDLTTDSPESLRAQARPKTLPLNKAKEKTQMEKEEWLKFYGSLHSPVISKSESNSIDEFEQSDRIQSSFINNSSHKAKQVKSTSPQPNVKSSSNILKKHPDSSRIPEQIEPRSNVPSSALLTQKENSQYLNNLQLNQDDKSQLLNSDNPFKNSDDISSFNTDISHLSQCKDPQVPNKAPRLSKQRKSVPTTLNLPISNYQNINIPSNSVHKMREADVNFINNLYKSHDESSNYLKKYASQINEAIFKKQTPINEIHNSKFDNSEPISRETYEKLTNPRRMMHQNNKSKAHKNNSIKMKNVENDEIAKEKSKTDKVNIYMSNDYGSSAEHEILLKTKEAIRPPIVSVSRIRVPLSSLQDQWSWVMPLMEQHRKSFQVLTTKGLSSDYLASPNLVKNIPIITTDQNLETKCGSPSPSGSSSGCFSAPSTPSPSPVKNKATIIPTDL